MIAQYAVSLPRPYSRWLVKAPEGGVTVLAACSSDRCVELGTVISRAVVACRAELVQQNDHVPREEQQDAGSTVPNCRRRRCSGEIPRGSVLTDRLLLQLLN